MGCERRTPLWRNTDLCWEDLRNKSLLHLRHRQGTRHQYFTSLLQPRIFSCSHTSLCNIPIIWKLGILLDLILWPWFIFFPYRIKTMPVLGLQAVEAQTKNKARGRLCLFPLFLVFGCLYSRSCSTISMPGIGSLTISCSVANLSGQNRKDLPPPWHSFHQDRRL